MNPGGSGRTPAFVAAILLTALAAAVYRSFVFSQFVAIREDVVAAELRSSEHAIKIGLPGLSALHGQAAVLDVSLRNTGSGERRVELLLDGFPTARFVLPADHAIRRRVVLSPGTVRALGVEAGGGTRSLELRSDADGWALTALEIRNYHGRLGDRPMAVILPGRAEAYTAGTGFVPVVMLLALLALANARRPTPESRSLRLIGRGLALAALLVCLTCLILPGVSPYKVLLSRFAFCLVAAGLFSPVLLYAARPLARRARSTLRTLASQDAGVRGAAARHFAIVSRYWAEHAVTFERGAALFALVAIGIAQPIFDVVSNSPEFFAARSTTVATAVAAVLAIGLGVPLVLLAIERAIRAISRRAAAWFHGAMLALLSAAVVMPWFRRGDVLASPWDVAIGAGIGLAMALAYARVRVVRQFLTALAPAAVAVPALFFLDSGVAQALLPTGSAAAAQTIGRTPPIVLVVFDELPLNSLLDSDGRIDEGRYPNFAALAQDGYWFRNASTVSSDTVWAVPAILAGRYPTASHAVPTLRYYPVNLFTVLARHYEIVASLRFQRLCPPGACQDNSAVAVDTVPSLLSDFGLVWLHIVLPRPLTERLPPVVGDWAEFGRPRATHSGDGRSGRAGVFARFLSSIDGRPARLYVIHSMLPHMAFQYVPSGREYRAPDYQTRTEKGRRLFERVSAAYADTLHQRHLAQVGYVDRLLGELIARLRDVAAYDKALIIVTADHGASYREGHARREPQERNLSDIIQVPLLIKLPGQQRGEVVDRMVETVDILPTILDVLTARSPVDLDGRSLLDDRLPDRSHRTFIFRDRSSVAPRVVRDSPADRAASLERKLHRFGSGDFLGLYAPPGARHLLGRQADGPAIRPAADVRITIDDQERFAAVARGRDPLPLYVRGVLDTPRSDPLNVAVVVNGIVAAVCQSYRERDTHVFGTLIPETSLRDGNNTVAALVVDGWPQPAP